MERDIKGDIVAGLDGKAFPNLKGFFETLQEPVKTNESVLKVLAEAQADPAGSMLLQVMEGVVATQNNRYNNFAAQASDTAVTTEKEINKYKEALTRIRVERDTWKEAAHGRSAGGGGIGADPDRDSAMPHPTPFTGDEKDTSKRTAQFQTWETRVEARWFNRPREFNAESKKILYAAALLEGTAATGVRTGIDKIMKNPTDPATWPWKTADEFMAHLERKYATLDLAADAENQLRKLAQKDEFAVFTDFLTEFTNLTDVCDWDGAARVRGFREKLSRRMREALNMQVNTPARDDFAGWVKMAQTLAVNLEGEDNLRKVGVGNNNGRSNNNNGGNNGGAKPKDPDAMDVDAMHVNLAKIPEEEKLRRMSDGLCFNCGQAGHLARNCKNPTNKGQRGGRGGMRGGHGGQYRQRSGYGGFSYPQSNLPGNNGYHGDGHQQQWQAQAASGSGNFNTVYGNQGAPTRRGGMRGRGGFRENLQPRLHFMDVPHPGHIVGEIGSEERWSGYQPSEYGGQGDEYDNGQGNA